MKIKDLYWLAGLLEGEGCFGVYKTNQRADGSRLFSAQVQIHMNDLDVIERAAALLDAKARGPYGAGRGGDINAQPYYAVAVAGTRAVKIMELVLPIMGQRRAARIRQSLDLHGQIVSNQNYRSGSKRGRPSTG